MFMILTKETIKEIQGRIVNWSSPAADGNLPYCGSAFITPEGTIQTVMGDMLEYAFVDDATGFYCYSDFGRFITITDF